MPKNTMKQHIPANIDNCVIIRIWTSTHNKKLPGNSDVGHASVEITSPYTYMSLWPEGQPSAKLAKAVLEKRTPYYMASYEEDFMAEDNHAPEVVIRLYTLNKQYILEKFNEIKSRENMGWTLLGNNIFIHSASSHSCASLALDLLKAGGIYELASSVHSFKFSSVVAPDSLVGTVKAAKKAEIQYQPETIEYDKSIINNNLDPSTILVQPSINI